MQNTIFNQKYLVSSRRLLRKNQTHAEELLWKGLRNSQLGAKFKRQYSIGEYILDFFCQRHNLSIEVDGSPHNIYSRKVIDIHKDIFLKKLGIKTLRFWNDEILNDMETVLSCIKSNLV